MNNRDKIRVTALILIFLAFTVTFALYTKDAENKEVSLSFGKIVSLTVGGSGETKDFNPDSPSQTIVITLKKQTYNKDQTVDSYTHGKFYVEILQISESTKPLAEQIIINATINETTYNNDTLVKTGTDIPKGYVAELTEEEITFDLTYSLSEEAKTDFLSYSEQTVEIKLHWDFCNAPTVTVYVKAPSSSESATWNYEIIESGATSNPFATGTLSFSGNNPWQTIEIPTSVSEIRFFKGESSDTISVYFTGTFADTSNSINLDELTKVWVDLDGDGAVYQNDPEQSE